MNANIEKVASWIENLKSEDIDLIDKVENLSEGDQISEKLYSLLTMEDSFFRNLVEMRINVILKSDTGILAGYILDETASLFDEGLIDEVDDFSSGLYNLDGLYINAINEIYEENTEEISKRLDVVRDFCYKVYKTKWLEENNLLTAERIIENYVSYSLSLYEGYFSPDAYSFEEYIEENGYKGSLYACFDEFLDCEYQECDYSKYFINFPILFGWYKWDKKYAYCS